MKRKDRKQNGCTTNDLSFLPSDVWNNPRVGQMDPIVNFMTLFSIPKIWMMLYGAASHSGMRNPKPTRYEMAVPCR